MTTTGGLHIHRFRGGAKAIFDALDDLSRTRALTDAESLALERAQQRMRKGRVSYGINKELARSSIGRLRG